MPVGLVTVGNKPEQIEIKPRATISTNTLAAALIAAESLSYGKPGSRRRTVGRDNGKAPARQKRNALCNCGSGRKYKKCCGRPK